MENARDIEWLLELTVDLVLKEWITYARITPLGWIVIVLFQYGVCRFFRWLGRRDAIAQPKN